MENITYNYFDIISNYWNKYIREKEPLPRSLDTIRPEILDSWRRSLEYQISPFELRHSILSKSEEVASDPFTPEILQRFAGYSWPGNVRELENIVERVIITAGDDAFQAEHLLDQFLPAELDRKKDVSSFLTDGGVSGAPFVLPTASNSPSKEYSRITAILREEHGHVPSAAERLQMPKRTLYRKIKKYNLNLEDYRKW